MDDSKELFELGVSEKDEGVVAEVNGQLPDLERRVRKAELARMLSGELDHSNAIVSIHPGTGGTDAKDWAQMLLRMMLRYCEKRGWKTEVIDYQDADDAGIDSAAFTVQGPYAYGYLRPEHGVHRLVRISPFDAQARRQTAFASVDVTPLLDDTIQVEINEADVEKVEICKNYVMRSGQQPPPSTSFTVTAGGQTRTVNVATGSCLNWETIPASPAPVTGAHLGDCNFTTTRWSATPRGELRLGAQCLTPRYSFWSGPSLELAACDGSPAQRWTRALVPDRTPAAAWAATLTRMRNALN